MNRIEKFIIIIGLTALVTGALTIRQQDAGYLAFQKGDYRTAQAEFSKLALEGDLWATHFTGVLHESSSTGIIDHAEAGKYYLSGARRGNIRSAIRYIGLLRRSKRLDQYCPLYTALVDKAVQTHDSYALVQKAHQLYSGNCVKKDRIFGTYFYKWAGEVKPQMGSLFSDGYARLSDSQKWQFEALKLIRPPHIDDQAFLKFFSAQLEQIGPVKIN